MGGSFGVQLGWWCDGLVSQRLDELEVPGGQRREQRDTPGSPPKPDTWQNQGQLQAEDSPALGETSPGAGPYWVQPLGVPPSSLLHWQSCQLPSVVPREAEPLGMG